MVVSHVVSDFIDGFVMAISVCMGNSDSASPPRGAEPLPGLRRGRAVRVTAPPWSLSSGRGASTRPRRAACSTRTSGTKSCAACSCTPTGDCAPTSCSSRGTSRSCRTRSWVRGRARGQRAPRRPACLSGTADACGCAGVRAASPVPGQRGCVLRPAPAECAGGTGRRGGGEGETQEPGEPSFTPPFGLQAFIEHLVHTRHCWHIASGRFCRKALAFTSVKL